VISSRSTKSSSSNRGSTPRYSLTLAPEEKKAASGPPFFV
jgi:hypothetical protein